MLEEAGTQLVVEVVEVEVELLEAVVAVQPLPSPPAENIRNRLKTTRQ